MTMIKTLFNNLKLIAFDLDDTLVAFDLVTDQSWLQACEKYLQQNPVTDSQNLKPDLILEKTAQIMTYL